MDECCLRGEKRERLKIHKEIERQLLIDKHKFRRELKLLVLGTEESGKSTLMKQMRITHGQGYNEEDRKSFTQPVYQNIITATQALISAMKTLNIAYLDDNIAYAEKLSQVKVSTVSTFEAWQVEAIRNIWKDHGVQICYGRRREYRLSDNAKYFLSDLDRITAPSYIPTVQDILRVWVPTTATTEYCFDLAPLKIRMIDVGGLWSKLRKFSHCFENVTSIIIMVALNQYDQNQLKETLVLFNYTLACPWFLDSSIILFLNKKDLLEKKNHPVPFGNVLPRVHRAKM